MRWRDGLWDHIADALKFLAGGGILISSILGSIWIIWFVGRFLLHLRAFLDRVLFADPW